jgi:hypothetical protein
VKRQERKNEARDGFEAGAAGIERELKRLVPAGLPPGSRDRVVRRAAEARGDTALAPWMRVAAAAGAALIGVILVLDPIQSRHEQARLAVLLEGRAGSPAEPDAAAELAEAGLGAEAALWSRLQGLAAAASRRSPAGAHLAVLERLKGWWEYEDPEDPY